MLLELGLGLPLETRVSVEGWGYGTRLGLAFVVTGFYGSSLELSFRLRVIALD